MRELRERAEPVLRIVVIILAAVVVVQLAGIIVRWNPFRGVTVPELPTLTVSTNAPASGGHGTNLAAAAGKGTNHTLQSVGTNATAALTNANSNFVSSTAVVRGTNFVAVTNLSATGTNTNTNAVSQKETKLNETNSVVATNTPATETNHLAATTESTNASLSVATTNTNSTAIVQLETTKTNAETNVIARLETKLSGTNSPLATNAADKGTNVSLAASGTNATSGLKKDKKQTAPGMPPEMAGMNFNPFGPPGKSSIELPPAAKARISKITDSEILGPVMHPLPMALLGIAGEVAFLRSASGQTGLVKTNDTLDDIKLIRIGVNRVLIEQAGEKKELMIFDGYGSESLLQNNSTNENKHP